MISPDRFEPALPRSRYWIDPSTSVSPIGAVAWALAPRPNAALAELPNTTSTIRAYQRTGPYGRHRILNAESAIRTACLIRPE